MSLATGAPPAVAPTTGAEKRLVRSSAPAWAAVASWGAGLLVLALGAPAATGGDILLGAVLLGTAAAALTWGVIVLLRGRLVTPRLAVAGALTGIVASVVTLAAHPDRTSVYAVAAACALLFAVALAAARQHRTKTDAAPPRIAVLLVAAVIVAGVVTPALGATEAGRLAPDHGSHGIVDPGHHAP